MNDQEWRNGVGRDAARLKAAEKERRSLLGQTVFLGTLSVLFLVPLIGGVDLSPLVVLVILFFLEQVIRTVLVPAVL